VLVAVDSPTARVSDETQRVIDKLLEHQRNGLFFLENNSVRPHARERQVTILMEPIPPWDLV
jgi:hypothetical protein